MTSIWSYIVLVRLLIFVPRPIAPWLVTIAPSIVMTFSPGPIPRMVKPPISPPAPRLGEMPGNRLATSPAFRFETFPSESVAAIWRRLVERRWAVIAAASPSRSPTTRNSARR